MESLQKMLMMLDPAAMQALTSPMHASLSPMQAPLPPIYTPPPSTGKSSRSIENATGSKQAPLPPILPQANPIESGSMAGINAVHRSLEDDNDMARQMAMSHIFSNLYKPHKSGNIHFGIHGLVNSLNESMPEAQKIYQKKKQENMDARFKLLQREDKLRQHAEEMALKKEKFAYDKEYNKNYLAYLMNKGNGTGEGGAKSNFGKLFQEREKVAKKFGENSKEVQKFDAYMDKLSGATKPGKSLVTSPVRTKQINAIIANEARQYMADHMEMPYVGEGSNAQLTKDVLEYKSTKDKKRKEELGLKLAKAANAVKLAPEYAQLQLAGQGVNSTVSAKHEQIKAIKQGWPELTNAWVNNLPKEIQEKANKLHSKSLRELSDIRENTFNKVMNNNVATNDLSDSNVAEPNSQVEDEYGYTPEDYEYTAEKHNQTVEDVKKWVQGGR